MVRLEKVNGLRRQRLLISNLNVFKENILDDPRVNGNYIVIPDISMMERVKEQKRHFT